MQRTFITSKPDELQLHQHLAELPRYEVPLTRAFIRRDVSAHGRFLSDTETVNVVTTLNQIKTFVDELALLDREFNGNIRVPFTNYVGLQFKNSGEAVAWARSFVARFFPDTEERLLRKALLNIPFDKTEIVWIGGDKYLPFVQRVAISPPTEELVTYASAEQQAKPALTLEEAAKKRAEIAARRGKKDSATQSAQ